MATYFSDYAVHFSTQAAGENGSIIWPKGDTDPLYVKLAEAGENVTATFQFTKKADGTNLYDYTIPMCIFTGIACLSLVVAFMLKRADKKFGYQLEEPNIQK